MTAGRKRRLARSAGLTVPEGMGWRPTLVAMLKALNAEQRGERFEMGEPPGPNWHLVQAAEWDRLFRARRDDGRSGGA